MSHGPRFKRIDTANYYSEQESYVQEKPYKAPLGYSIQRDTVKPGRDWTVDAWMGHMYYASLPYYLDNSLKTRAYEKFRDKANTYMQWAVNYVERQSAISSLTNRVNGAAELLWNIRHRRWRQIARAAKRNGKNWNQTFLEFHFGWIPLCADVYSTMETLFEVPPGLPIRIRVSTEERSGFRAWDSNQYHDEQTGLYGVGITGLVTVNNPNLLLLNKLGLLNPASIAWELVPYSFVLDWFANINTVLSQFTDFAGLNTDLVSYTTRCEGTRKQYYTTWDGTGILWDGPAFKTFEMKRYTGLPTILPAIKPLKRLSVTRGVTAIALLLNHASPFSSLFKPFKS